MHRVHGRLLSSLTVLVLAACGGKGSGGDAPVAAQSVAVEVAPPSATLATGASVGFDATVTGTADTTVVWTVVEQGGGTVDATGLYTAPAAPGTFRVRATSRANAQAFSESTVTVRLPVTVAVSPATASVVAGGTVAFTATVANTTNGAVTWSVPGTSCGTVTQAGVYTAPATAGTCSVVATSQADPTRSATAVVTVTAPPAPITVAVAPSPGAVDACKTLAFNATVGGTANQAVNWTVQEPAGGTITSAGVYTAPNAAGTYHVVATSQADATRSTIAAVTVADRVLSVAVTPQTIQLAPGGTAQFTATVTTTCGTFASTQTVAAAAL